MPGFHDTIIAPITGSQAAAVTVLRISGVEALSLGRAIAPFLSEAPTARHLFYGTFRHGDDGLAVWFPEGQSFTGEATVEVHVHGSPASVAMTLELAYAAGARAAEPGEFTLRAFMNGRIDLTQAEAIRETVDALTDDQLRAANWVRQGGLFEAIRGWRDEILGVLAAVEASTDFSEEVGDLDRPSARSRLSVVLEQIRLSLSTATTGQILREGVRIALIGPPNAGKSSLLNAIVGRERAIVTPIAGTTRDTIEETVSLGGVACHLIDTAGLRETTDQIEQLGLNRSREAADRADLVWFIYDSASPPTTQTDWLDTIPSGRLIRVANKSDLNPTNSDDAIPVSAMTGAGIPDLVAATLAKVAYHPTPDLRTINRRHAPLLAQTLDEIVGVISTLSQNVPDDLAAVGLRAALHSLGEITGETASPDVITRIFQDFCIGK